VNLAQQELEERLWAAANALRGPVDPADFKPYVFPMLFWKWISDTWAYEHRQALDDWGDDITDEIEADYQRFTVPEGCPVERGHQEDGVHTARRPHPQGSRQG